MKRFKPLLPLIALAFLPACSLFDDTDPREGAETTDMCVERLAGMALDDALSQEDAVVTPTYTYDITKVSLEDLQELTVPGSDETAGARGMTATNETSTAVDNFMADPVDEKGAFFMGRDPALYRVRGEAVAAAEAITVGCARQKAGMRLISFTAEFASSAPETDEPEEPAQ